MWCHYRFSWISSKLRLDKKFDTPLNYLLDGLGTLLFLLIVPLLIHHYAGKNLAGQGLPLVLHAQTGDGVNNFGGAATACLVDLFVVHDVMYILDGATGIITANS